MEAWVYRVTTKDGTRWVTVRELLRMVKEQAVVIDR